jgi:hypothetical protein
MYYSGIIITFSLSETCNYMLASFFWFFGFYFWIVNVNFSESMVRRCAWNLNNWLQTCYFVEEAMAKLVTTSQNNISSFFFWGFDISYWDLIKFPYFADTTKRGVRGWKRGWRQGEERVTLQISLVCSQKYRKIIQDLYFILSL